MLSTTVLALFLPLATGYAAPFTPRTGVTSSVFSAAGLATHATGLADDAHSSDQQCPAAPLTLDIAAPPRALPKRSGDGPVEDPLGLWKQPTAPGGPKGPNVYQLNKGRAIDMLRKDYPNIFTQKPDMSIFTKEMELHDSSGRRLKGLKQYEKLFDAMRFLRRTTMQDAQVTYRLVVVDETIRVRWSAKLWMRDPALGLTTLPVSGDPVIVHLDGVSNYELDAQGKVYKHTLENIVMNGPQMAEPVQLKFAWPSLAGAAPELAVPAGGFFEPLGAGKNWQPPKELARFFASAPPGAGGAAELRAPRQAPRAAQPAPRRGGDVQAMAKETPMERAARERAEDAEKARRLEEMRSAKEEEPRSLFGLTAPQACDTSYDCERPDVCCDLIFGSFCCSGGLMIPTREGNGALQRQAIPIPVEADNGVPRFPAPEPPTDRF